MFSYFLERDMYGYLLKISKYTFKKSIHMNFLFASSNIIFICFDWDKTENLQKY